MVRVLFASRSPSRALRGDIRRLLAGIDVVPVTFAVDADVIDTARAAFAAFLEPIIVERVTYRRASAHAMVALADAGGVQVFEGTVTGILGGEARGDGPIDEAEPVPAEIGPRPGPLG